MRKTRTHPGKSPLSHVHSPSSARPRCTQFVVIVSRMVVNTRDKGVRAATLLWAAVVLGSLLLVWPAILFMLYWCAVLVSAGWLGDLTEGFPDAFANLLQLSQPFAVGGCLMVLALATGATVLDLRQAQVDRTAPAAHSESARPESAPRQGPAQRPRKRDTASSSSSKAETAPDRPRVEEKGRERPDEDGLPPRYRPGVRPPES